MSMFLLLLVVHQLSLALGFQIVDGGGSQRSF